MQDCLANDYFDNVDKYPERKFSTATNESDDALSNYSVTTTESDHRELLRLIKRRKQDKFKAARMTRSAKEYQKKKLSAELLQGTILSDDDTTEIKTKKSIYSNLKLRIFKSKTLVLKFLKLHLFGKITILKLLN